MEKLQNLFSNVLASYNYGILGRAFIVHADLGKCLSFSVSVMCFSLAMNSKNFFLVRVPGLRIKKLFNFNTEELTVELKLIRKLRHRKRTLESRFALDNFG